MSRLTVAWAFALSTLLFQPAARQTSAQQAPEWTWKDNKGTSRNRSELEVILGESKVWAESNGKSGSRADLHGATLTMAPLEGVDLYKADLFGASLIQADMHGAHLEGADLRKSFSEFADLHGAHLQAADLTSAYLGDADLRGAILAQANLTDVGLNGSDMQGANLEGTNLGRARFFEVNLDRVIFEPASLPDLYAIATARNLELLTYFNNPVSLVLLRKQFQDGGFRDQERKITYALKRREAEQSWNGCTSRKLPEEDGLRPLLWPSDSNLANCSSWLLNRVFFDLPCQYGMNPGRPLSLGALLWLLCSVLYFACIRVPGNGGLYRVYVRPIQVQTATQPRIERISPPAVTHTRGVRQALKLLRSEWAMLRASMFFSLMSAFNIGFRDINFGRWLRLLTRQEFDIKAVGWARVLSGWQSLISVYMIALWVLTYFGRPFG